MMRANVDVAQRKARKRKIIEVDGRDFFTFMVTIFDHLNLSPETIDADSVQRPSRFHNYESARILWEDNT
jgi:hypothetical protein